MGEKANEKGKSRKGTNQDQGRSLLDEKNTAIKKAEGPTTLFTGHKDREERRTGEGKVEEGVGIALLSCLECSTVFFSLPSNDVIYFLITPPHTNILLGWARINQGREGGQAPSPCPH